MIKMSIKSELATPDHNSAIYETYESGKVSVALIYEYYIKHIHDLSTHFILRISSERNVGNLGTALQWVFKAFLKATATSKSNYKNMFSLVLSI